ncbi:MAG: [protein-PII] uridylyltransferase, partial [Actinobacteria bacterium]|nr:[protein-PII] uridylyltransferase [Actinomycetota bacterium]
SVRTPKEAAAIAREDLKTALTLLDGRVIAGDEQLGASTLQRVRNEWVRDARRRLPGLGEITEARHEREGDVAYLLEPELKEAKGGLRDLTVLRAMQSAVPFPKETYRSVEGALRTLFSTRVELHRVTSRSIDRLSLDTQDDVASRTGVDADALMTEVSSAGRSVARAWDDTWRRTRASLAGPKSRRFAAGDHALDDGVVLRDGEVDLRADARVEDGSLLLRVAEQAARLDAPIAYAALRQLGASAPSLPAAWTDAARHAFVGLLESGPPLITVFETLDEYDLVTRILPEWEQVRSRPQRNAFHRFTVDRHLTEAVAQAATLATEVDRPDLLLVGALLHDLGKGWPGDHTDAGVELAEKIATRMAFAPADRAVIVALVRHHLLLPRVATSRDPEDAATVALVADAVGTPQVLHLLAALTKADSLATGATAWSAWKEELVATLVARVDDYFAGSRLRAERSLTDDERALVEQARDRIVVNHGDDEVTIAAPDRPGLFSTIVALLTIHGADVRSAEVRSTDDGVALDSFSVVTALRHGAVDWDGFTRELTADTPPSLALESAIDARARTYRKRVAAAYRPRPVVVAHPAHEANGARIIEVRAADAVGLLYRITQMITKAGLDIRRAMVSTLGHEVVDSFYVRTLDRTQPDDATVQRLVESLLEVVQEDGAR